MAKRLLTRLSSHALRRRIAVALGIFVAYSLVGYLVLPPLIKWGAEKYIADKSAHVLTVGKVKFNPFALSLTLHDLKLSQPDGEPLLGFDQLFVDFELKSVLRWAYAFDDIRLSGPWARVELRPDGQLNWSAFLEAFKDEENKDEGLPRLLVGRIAVDRGRVEFVDRKVAGGFNSRLEPVDFELVDLSTLPDDKGAYTLSLRNQVGTRIRWRGQIALNPMQSTGELAVDDVLLSRLAPYLDGRLRIAPPEGKASARLAYRAAYADKHFALNLDDVAATLTGLALRGEKEAQPALTVDKLELSGGRFDLAKRELRVAKLALSGGGLKLTRSADGRLNLQEWLLPAKGVTASGVAQQGGSAPWHVGIDAVELAGYGLTLRDQGMRPALALDLQDIRASVRNLSEDLNTALPVSLGFKLAAGGSFEAEGTVVPATPAADLKLNLARLSLKPAQPYVAQAANLVLTSGSVSGTGRLRYDGSVRYDGDFSLHDLLLKESASGNRFLSLRRLSTRGLQATPERLAIGSLQVDGLGAKLIIHEDKSVNLKRIIKASPAPAAERKKAGPDSKFRVTVDTVKVANSEMDFADLSLALPFGTHIHHLKGHLNGISSRPGGTPAQLELEGLIDDYGLARAVGQINLFDPTGYMDIKTVFRNVEMTRLTPYSATFAGRKIASGKLSLDLEYKIKDRQLAGDNQVIMDKLTLGERVESPKAKDLPLDLAIAILSDSEGRIDLGLPVSGSLDDPQFSYGQIVWKAIVNVITKIVTAPFRALGKLLGISGEQLEHLAFDPGSAVLLPPERETLKHLAQALGKRPNLVLLVKGTWDPELDRARVKESRLRAAMAKGMGLKLAEGEEAPPVSTANPKVQDVIETLYESRVGKAELKALKARYYQANPGKQPTMGKMLSALSGLVRQEAPLAASELESLKGADLHALMYGQLLEKEVVSDEVLTILANKRAGAIANELIVANGIARNRIEIGPPQSAEGKGKRVEIGLSLGVAGKSLPQASPNTEAIK